MRGQGPGDRLGDGAGGAGGAGRRPPLQQFDFPSDVKPMAGCGCFSLVLLTLLCGIANVEVQEYALNYSLLTRKVERNTYASGRYWIGPFNYFVKFPSVVKTIQFSDAELQHDMAPEERSSGLLRSRTSDGLDVSIELSFQYQLKKDELYDLYTTLGPAPFYHKIYSRIAMDLLTEGATDHSATEFFVDRTTIGKTMEAGLRKDFERRLYATIFSFQLRSVQLPAAFEDAIQETEVMKQDLQVAKAEQNSTRVSLETELMKATRRTKVKSNIADARAQATMLANSADIEQYTMTQHKAADSYAKVMEALDGNEEDVLAYMEARVLRDHPSELTTVGLGSPAGSKESL